MRSRDMTRGILLLVGAAILGTFAPIYRYPRYGGVVMDWCLDRGRSCGWSSAHWYCRQKGHRGARSYRTTRPGRTYRVGARNYCYGAGCVGYSAIQCAGGGYGGRNYTAPNYNRGRRYQRGYRGYRRTFYHPRINGLIVDHCRWFAASCGWPAAHYYCRLRGYSRSLSWSRYRPGRTWVAGSRRVCRGFGCVGFKRVSCVR
jgi:hypothetical protein